MAAYLAVVSGAPAARLILDAPGSFIAGRAPECALILSHVEVSRQHCCFHWDGEHCTVEELGSRRGTQLNGKPLEEKTELKPGDRVSVGPVELELRLGTPAGSEMREAPSSNGRNPMFVQGAPADRIEPPIGDEWIIGRNQDCHVVLPNPGVSRQHASVRMLPGSGCLVTDLRSTGGSFVNGHRFESQQLTVGDRLQIGPYDFQYDGRALFRTVARGSSIVAEHVVQRGTGGVILLNDLTLAIGASQFAGILGPSGAGKSTLLHTLAGLQPPANGRVLVDGDDVYTSKTHAFGLVPQEDIVHRELTILQALQFAARLRLPATTPHSEVQKLIVQTMEHLGLKAIGGRRIARLSGGQRKRVNVAVELLARPAILFLDEPSSGLDPATEFQLMEVLRALTNTGCTVICTTHVMENAYLMDQLAVVTGGCLAFSGTAQEARRYFRVEKLHALYDRLQEQPAAEWKKQYEELHPPAETLQPAAPVAHRRPKLQKRAPALPVLLHRQWAIQSSDWRNFVILATQPLIIAVLVAWASSDQSLALFFAYVATLWFGCSNGAQEIVKEVPIYQRERLIGVNAHAWLGSKFLFLFATTSLQALLLYGALFTCLGWNKLEGDPGFQIISLLGASAVAVGIGCAISSMAKTVMQAVLIVPLVLIPQILLSGHPVPAMDMKQPVYTVARVIPAFASQTLMDQSFLWKKKITHDTLSDHWTSFRNISRQIHLHTGEVYTETEPSNLAMTTHVIWTVVCYILAWLGLRKKEH